MGLTSPTVSRQQYAAVVHKADCVECISLVLTRYFIESARMGMTEEQMRSDESLRTITRRLAELMNVDKEDARAT